MVALNALGVAAGKMISPQTLAIGLAAVLVRGKDANSWAPSCPTPPACWS